MKQLLLLVLFVVPGLGLAQTNPSSNVPAVANIQASVKVSGRVRWSGELPVKTPIQMILTGTTSRDNQTTPLLQDSTFEFSEVLPGEYALRMNPPLPVPDMRITVPAGKDLSVSEIIVPPVKEVVGRVMLGGAGTIASAPSLLWISIGATPVAVRSVLTIAPDGSFKVILPEGEGRLSMDVRGFSIRSFTHGSVNLLQTPFKLSATDSSELGATLEPLSTSTLPGGITGGVVGGVTAGVIGGVFVPGSVTSSRPSTFPPPPPIPPPTQSLPRVGGSVAQANLIYSVPPEYPAPARAARVQGSVVLECTIAKDGTVRGVRVVSGQALLKDSATEAVRQWRYKPFMLNGEPTEIVTTVTVNFTLE